MLYSQISVHEEIHSFCDAVFYEKLLRGQMECAKKQFCQITTVQGKIICDFLHGQVVLIVFMNVGNGAADIDAVVISFFAFSLSGSFGQDRKESASVYSGCRARRKYRRSDVRSYHQCRNRPDLYGSSETPDAVKKYRQASDIVQHALRQVRSMHRFMGGVPLPDKT